MSRCLYRVNIFTKRRVVRFIQLQSIPWPSVPATNRQDPISIVAILAVHQILSEDENLVGNWITGNAFSPVKDVFPSVAEFVLPSVYAAFLFCCGILNPWFTLLSGKCAGDRKSELLVSDESISFSFSLYVPTRPTLQTQAVKQKCGYFMSKLRPGNSPTCANCCAPPSVFVQHGDST